jgi:protein-disulfide isomerase
MNLRWVPVIWLLSLILLQPRNARGQGGDREDQAHEDVLTLKQRLDRLQAEHQQIIIRLDELKQLLQSNTQLAKSAVPPRPQPPSTLEIHGENFRGDRNARVAIIEYADFECPYCGEYENNVFPQLLRDYIETCKLKYFYRDLPLPMHPFAVPAARAARCAGEQGKYWEMLDSLFAKQNALSAPALLDRAQTLGLDTAKFTECLSSDKYNEDIRKNISDAQKFGIDGTPTFFIGTIEGDVVNIKNGIKGSSPFEVFKTDLDALVLNFEMAAPSSAAEERGGGFCDCSLLSH